MKLVNNVMFYDWFRRLMEDGMNDWFKTTLSSYICHVCLMSEG